jgi:uncharacterized protein (DUF302 family)
MTMMKSWGYFCLTIVLFVQFELSFTMLTNDQNVIKVKSKYSVKETIDSIENDTKAQSGTVFVRIDQKKAAEDAGIIGQLDDNELILFGNPKVGTQLMLANESISVELPLRAACWKKNDTVYLSVTNPLAFEISYNLASKKDVLQMMRNNVDQMINKVSL